VIAGESVHFEMKAKRKDGTPMDVEMHAVPIRYRGAPHALGMARDITAKKRAEAERAQLEAQLRQAQKMEAIGHLTGGIAHDFNNILTGILGYARLAAERPAVAEDAKLARALEEVELACNRARELIQQMLVFSRGRRGAARAVALAPLVRQGIRLLRSSLPPAIEITAELAAEVPAALLDPVQADQVLMNLCINARDAMRGQGSLRIRVSGVALHEAICASCRARVSGNFVELSVADCGPGIAPEVMERMFEPFFTTKGDRGTGLGLAQVFSTVERHRGRIGVTSAPGLGTTFRLTFPTGMLPSTPEHRVAAIPPVRATEPAPTGGDRRPLRVLAVDDEPHLRELVAVMMGGDGHAVTTAASGEEALEHLANGSFDLVISDVGMGAGINGWELGQQVRARFPGVRFALATGWGAGIDPAEARAGGVDAVVAKPFRLDDLRRLVADVLGTPERAYRTPA
jgi:signal transduction histidine kinase/ActR/RegA family two-component response regulator